MHLTVNLPVITSSRKYRMGACLWTPRKQTKRSRGLIVGSTPSYLADSFRSATIALLEISELKSMWPQCAAVIPDRVASAAIILGPWHMDAPEAMADLFFESIESSRFWAAA